MASSAFAFDLHRVECTLAFSLSSVPQRLVMLRRVRHAGVVRPAPTTLLAALSTAGTSAAAVSIIHAQQTALMGLSWHVGAVAMLSAGGRLMGHHLFAWLGDACR